VVQHLDLDVLADDLAHLGEELLLVAGQEAAVNDRGGLAGDHVRLVARGEHRRVRGVAQGRADHAGHRPELGDRRVHVVGVEGDAE
jgi:hypothetical protein